MRAVVIDPEAGTLRIDETAVPQPRGRQALVAVRAAGVNRADLAQRAGRYRSGAVLPGAPPGVAGLEMAGEVVAVGPGVRRLRVGQHVLAMSSAAYAEYTVIDERIALDIPQGRSFVEAAALPVAALTAHDALVTHGRLRLGRFVLITASASVVGLAALQLARRHGAGRVVGVATTDRHERELRALGLSDLVSWSDAVGPAIRRAVGDRGVDIVLDLVGGPHVGELMSTMRVGGRLISVGRLGGTTADVDLDLLARQRLSLVGVSFRSRSLAEVVAIVDRLRRDHAGAPLPDALTVPVDRTFPLERVDEAHRHLVTGHPFGKVVLTI